MTDITTLPLWRDYSAHQDDQDTPQLINMLIAKNNGVKGVYCRASKSWTYKDPVFQYVYEQAGALGLYRTSYHVFSPGADINNQLKVWYEQHPEIDTIPRVMDIEVNWNNCTPRQIGVYAKTMSDEILSRDGVRPILYCGSYRADDWITPFWSEGLLNEHYWIVPQYDDHRDKEENDPVRLANGIDVSRIIMKQTADHIPGFPGETESTNVDRNRWVLDQEMHQFIAETWGGVLPPPPPQTDLEARVTYLENLTDVMNSDLEETHEMLLALTEKHNREIAGIGITLARLNRLAHTHWWIGELDERII